MLDLNLKVSRGVSKKSQVAETILAIFNTTMKSLPFLDLKYKIVNRSQFRE